MLPPGGRILKRLDRLYFSEGRGGAQGDCSSTILPGFAFSDHAPIWGILSFGNPQARPSCYRMNAAHFDNPTFKDRIKTMWGLVEQRGVLQGWSPSVTLQKCIGQARRIDRSWGKRMAKEKRFKLDGLQASLASAQLALEGDPSNAAAQLILMTRKEELLTFCATQANWVEMVMQARWIMEGDRGTTLFYKSFKSLAAAKSIHELVDTDGSVKSSWEDLAAVTTKFFASALGDGPDATERMVDPTLLEEVLAVQSDRVSVLEKEELNAPISLEELGDSVRDLANGKCPGTDGTPIEFFKENWETVGPLVHASIVRSISEEHFPPFFTKGAIVLLKKKDDQRLLGNKRPITLLNSVYKIGAKAMQRRLSPILQKIISPQQCVSAGPEYSA